MIRSEIEPLMVRLIRGAKSPAGQDDPLLDACYDGKDRALFFAPVLRPLQGLGSSIEALLKTEPVEGAVGVTRQLIAKVAAVRQPCSLESILAVGATVKAIRNGRHRSEGAKLLANRLDESFRCEEVLPEGSIIHSMHAPDPQRLKELREKLGNKPAVEFSRDLMAGAFRDVRREQAFYGHLENGYPVNSHHKAGRYKLTKASATLLWKRLERLAEPKFLLETFDLFAPVDVEAGPRNGQISQGLRVDWGNLTS